MNGDRAKDKARTLARKQARKLKREGEVPSTQQRPAQVKVPKGWAFVETKCGD